MTRRDFLSRGATATLVATIAPVALPRLARTQRPQRVIIVGAGLAGLSAAFELVNAGHDVTVFEARTRPGGRVYTLREPFADELYAEAGATSLPISHGLVLHYARLFDLPLVPLLRRSGAFVAYFRGQRLVRQTGQEMQWPVELTDEERKLGVSGMQRKYWGRELEAAAGADAPGWPPESLRRYDKLTLADLWRQNGASEAAVAIMRFGFLEMLGDGVDSYSALNGLREVALRRPGQPSHRIDGGNDKLPKAFASRLRSRIQYGRAVVGLSHNPESVRVTIRDSSGTHEVAADRVVCAIPFSVLRDIQITPSFSPGKQRAIRELLYTSVTRVYLQSQTRFWAADGLSGNALIDLPIMSVDHVTAPQPGPRAILETYSTGAHARRLAGMGVPDRLRFALDQTSKVFPNLRSNFEGGVSVNWDEDPWAKGAYTWFKPGQMTMLLPHIARSEGRVHFAGDHTSALPGWMQGALESGQRVVTEINAA